MKVEQIMTRPVVSCAPDDTLHRAAQLMWENDCGCLPVVDASARVVGMVTDRDACMAAYTKGAPLWDIRVADVMTRDVATCGPGDDIASVEQEMGTRQIRRVPVVRDRELVAMISLNDLALATQQGNGKRGSPTAKELAATLADISRHRIVASAAPQHAAAAAAHA
jgi:CBS domain-containing protein